MDVTVTAKEKSQKELAVRVSADEWAKEIDAAVAHIGAQMNITGFRKGKAPKDVVLREAGKETVLAEAAERAIKKAYAAAIKQEGVQAIAQPTISVTKLAEGEPLAFTATVTVLPEVTLKKNWKKAIAKVNAENAAADDATVDDAAVDEAIAKMAQQRAEHVLAERPAQKDDVAIIDFTVEVDGAPVEGGTGKDHPLVLGSGAFIPGFEDAVIGMTAGETKAVTLPFPKEYHAKHLAGKEATFTITLNRVEERVVPAIDDAFAQKVHAQAKTVADLKKFVRENLEQEKRSAQQQKRREALADALADIATADIPEQLIDNEVDRMRAQFEQQLAQSGTTLDDMLAQLKKTKEELFKDWRPQAAKRALIGLALDAIADAEDIQPDKAKVEAEMQQLLALYGGEAAAKKRVDLTHLYDYAKGMLQQEAVFAYLEGLTA